MVMALLRVLVILLLMWCRSWRRYWLGDGDTLLVVVLMAVMAVEMFQQVAQREVMSQRGAEQQVVVQLAVNDTGGGNLLVV